MFYEIENTVPTKRMYVRWRESRFIETRARAHILEIWQIALNII